MEQTIVENPAKEALFLKSISPLTKYHKKRYYVQLEKPRKRLTRGEFNSKVSARKKVMSLLYPPLAPTKEMLDMRTYTHQMEHKVSAQISPVRQNCTYKGVFAASSGPAQTATTKECRAEIKKNISANKLNQGGHRRLTAKKTRLFNSLIEGNGVPSPPQPTMHRDHNASRFFKTADLVDGHRKEETEGRIAKTCLTPVIVTNGIRIKRFRVNSQHY